MAKKSIKSRKIGRGQLPVKRSINLVGANKKQIDPKLALPGIVIILIFAFLIGKFAVADRLVDMYREQMKASELQAQIDEGYRKIASFGELAEQYSHYTYSGMTEDELDRRDRVEVIDMIRRVVVPRTRLNAWTISDNILDLTVTGSSLQEINLMAERLSDEEIVDFCTVATASTNDNNYYYGPELGEDSSVTARITVYLNGQEEEAVF